MDWIYFHGNKTNPGKFYFQELQLEFSIGIVISPESNLLREKESR